MAAYTIYLIDPSGRVRLGETVEKTDDAAAIIDFRASDLDGLTAELWQGGRLVARRNPEGGLSLKMGP